VEPKVFLDTAYAIALAADSDQFHDRATALADQLEASKTRFVTTEAVLLEIGNALAKQRYRKAAVQLLASLASDPDVEIVPLTHGLFDRGFAFYCNRADKDWGLTDCLSFVVMTERGLTESLTSDDHFKQAGFIALLQ
jgi:uncharacterized protein